MIYQLTKKEDVFLEKTYEEAMKDLGAFYEINWTRNKPMVIVVNSRDVINALVGKETERWTAGWNIGNRIFILDNEVMEKESSHRKRTEEEYASTVKHELSHAFFEIIGGKNRNPAWLGEGVAIYTSEQIRFKKKPETFKSFLGYYSEGGEGVYKESGFAVELLVNKFGKHKLLELIKSLKDTKTQEDFDKKFHEIYGFKPTYEEFNKLNG